MLAGLNLTIPPPKENDNAKRNAVANSAIEPRKDFCEGIDGQNGDNTQSRSEANGRVKMTNSQRIGFFGLLLVVVLASVTTAGAQDVGKREPSFSSATQEPTAINKPQKEGASRPHRFWDKENGWLFAGVGAARTLDYFSTLNMRRRGRQEIFLTNDVVDNHAAFATVEAAATGVSIGASYLFHHYGHHKLERWTSFVHIGLATTGAVRNYCLKTAHLAIVP